MTAAMWIAGYVCVGGVVAGALCEMGLDYIAVPVASFWPIFAFVPVGRGIVRLYRRVMGGE